MQPWAMTWKSLAKRLHSRKPSLCPKGLQHVLEKAPSRSLPVLEKKALEKVLPIKESHGLSSGKWIPKKNNPGSYICGMVKGGRMHLILRITKKMRPHYKALIGKIREALEKDSLTKEEALSMRGKLLEKYAGS